MEGAGVVSRVSQTGASSDQQPGHTCSLLHKNAPLHTFLLLQILEKEEKGSNSVPASGAKGDPTNWESAVSEGCVHTRGSKPWSAYLVAPHKAWS